MQRQRSTILTTVIAFLAVLVLVQLWLLVEAEHAELAGDSSLFFPAALV